MGFFSRLFGTSDTPPAEERAYVSGFKMAHIVGGGITSRKTDTGKAFAEVPALYRVVDKVSTSVARAGWMAVRVKNKKPTVAQATANRQWARRLALVECPLERRSVIRAALENEDLEELPNHELLTVWERGVPEMDSATQVYMIQLYMMLHGEVHVAINRSTSNGNKPISVQPFPPHAVDETQPQGKARFRFKHDPNREPRVWEYPREDVFTLRKPDPKNPYALALGMAQVLVNELDIDEYSAIATAARFKNGMNSDLLVQVQGVGKEGLQRTEAKMMEKHAGPWAAGRPIVTDAEAISVEQLSPTLVDMDVANLRSQVADLIREVPGIPPEIFGHVVNSNRATIAAAQYLYGLHVVDPALWLLARGINHHLSPRFDNEAFLIYESPIPEDREFRAQIMSDHPGSFTKNEKRALADSGPRADGDTVQGTSYTAGQIQQMLKIVEQVAARQIDRSSGVAMLVSTYSMKPAEAEKVIGPASFKPEPPPVKPGNPGNGPGFNQDDTDKPNDEENPGSDGTLGDQ